MKTVIFASIFLLILIPCMFGSIINWNKNKKPTVVCEMSISASVLLLQNNEIIYPSSYKSKRVLGRPTIAKFQFDSTRQIQIACSGGSILIGQTNTGLNIASISCENGNKFKINNQLYSTRTELTCSGIPMSTIRRTGLQCGNVPSQEELEVGLPINNLFFRTFSICFDQFSQSTLYSTTTIIAGINKQIRDSPRPQRWSQGANIYTITDVNHWYIRGVQRRTINELVGLSSGNKQYIKDDDQFFLSRGHLIARVDLFYVAQQDSTFFLQNALPQWQSFNSHNWEIIEKSIRDYAQSRNVNLQVWAGGYGATSLQHATNKANIPLYLFVNKNYKNIPVPEIFWKIVLNPVTNQGVVLIGVNNPYKSLNQINKFCPDQSGRLAWLQSSGWNSNNQTSGISWACSVDDFKRIVHTAPNIYVSGLLI